MTNTANDDVLDPDDVIFDEDGRPESMTDPDTGEVVKADPASAAAPEKRVRDIDANDQTLDDDGLPLDQQEARRLRGGDNSSAASSLDPVLADALAGLGFAGDDGTVDDAIEWNGVETRVRDLSPADRREFMAEAFSAAVREQAGLNEAEQELLDFVRQGGNLREAFGGSAPEAGGANALGADELNRAEIRQLYPDLGDEEVEEELAHRKGSPRYEKTTQALRTRFVEQEQAAEQRQAETEYQQERQVIAKAASELTQVLGFPVEKEVQQYLLERTTKVEDNGQTAFMNSLTAEKALRLEFLDTFSPQIEQHYQQVEADGYKRGRADALNGAPSRPSGRSGSAVAGANKNADRNESPVIDFTLQK